jgi:hypothetical protein
MGMSGFESGERVNFKAYQRNPISRIIHIAVSILAVLVCMPAEAQNKRSLAVIDFSAGPTAKLSQEDRRALTDAVRNQANRSLNLLYWEILPREKVEAIIPSGKKNLVSCNEKCIAKVVKKKSVDYVITGSVAAVGSGLQVTLNAYNTASGMVEVSDVVRASNVDSLLEPLEKRSVDLFQKIGLGAAYAGAGQASETSRPFVSGFSALGGFGSLPIGNMAVIYKPGVGGEILAGLRFGGDFSLGIYGLTGITAYPTDPSTGFGLGWVMVEVPARVGASVYVGPFVLFTEAGPHYYREPIGEGAYRYNIGFGGAAGGMLKVGWFAVFARARVQNINYTGDTQLYEAGLRWYTGR